VHPTLGILARFQAFSYASAFSQLDGVPPPAPARVTQTVGQFLAKHQRAKPNTIRVLHMKYYGLNFLIIMASFLLLGCASKTPEEIAAKIRVSYPVSQEISKAAGVGIEMDLINESNYCVIFPQVSGMTIYTEKSGSRLEVNNLITIMGDENLVVNSQGEIFSKRSVDIAPDVSGITITAPTQFFVSLSGYLCDDENVKIIKVIPFTVTP
jgi:hypothetical protein